MFSQRFRVYNDCSKSSINLKLYIVFPLSGLVLNGEDFGAIEPRKHKDILFRGFGSSIFPCCSQQLSFEFGEIKKRVTVEDILECKKIRLIEDQNEMVVKIVQGNCFERIGIVWTLKDFAKGCGKKIKIFVKKLGSRQKNYNFVTIRDIDVMNWVGQRELLASEPAPARF